MRLQRWTILRLPTITQCSSSLPWHVPILMDQSDCLWMTLHHWSLYRVKHLKFSQIHCLSVTSSWMKHLLIQRSDICGVRQEWLTRHRPKQVETISHSAHRTHHCGRSTLGNMCSSSRTLGTVLQELHSNHPGNACMKKVAWSYVWWPKLDQHIEELVNSCIPC